MKRFLRLRDYYALTKHKRKPYTIRFISLLAVLTSMCLYAVKQVSAQEAEPAAAAVTDIKPLQIGDTIPEHLWHLPLQVVNRLPAGGKNSITLKDYRDKLIILDFWATWCKPCISSLYKLDTLQKQFTDEIAVIPATYEAKEKADTFIANKGWSLPSAVGDTILKKYFPHQSIPHQVWIKAGRVEAIVGPEYAQADMISDVLAGKHVAFRHKIEVPFDKTKPLFLGGNGGDGANMLYQSVISGRLQAKVAGVSRPAPNEILAYNQTVEKLYRIALGDSISPLHYDSYISKYIIHEISDSLKFKINASEIIAMKDPIKLEDWADENAYCYNLVLPKNKGLADLNDKMLEELNDFFCGHLGLTVHYETRQRDALALVCIEENKKILTKGGRHIRESNRAAPNLMTFQNESIPILIHFLNSALTSTNKPIVDETGMTTNIDMDINLSHKDVQAMRKELAKHGLDLIEKPALVKMIVFTHCDKPNQNEK